MTNADPVQAPVEAYIVDAFTDTAFAGNPAAVVLLDGPREEGWLQAAAAEFNLSETAFVEPPDAAGVRPLRWFTPRTEVDLCGHATLASGHVLGGTQSFSTRSGVLTSTATSSGWVEMDFPADHAAPAEPDINVLAGLPGITVTAIARGAFDFLVEARYAAEVRGLTPDFAVLGNAPARGVIVTAPGDRPGIDFVSRCFYPGVGIGEDPVTGSAHCTLACWWADRVGRTEMTGEQASPRGGIVRMVLAGERVRLAGQAVIVLRGQLRV